AEGEPHPVRVEALQPIHQRGAVRDAVRGTAVREASRERSSGVVTVPLAPSPMMSRASSPIPPSVPISWVASIGNRIVLALGLVANLPIALVYSWAMK